MFDMRVIWHRVSMELSLTTRYIHVGIGTVHPVKSRSFTHSYRNFGMHEQPTYLAELPSYVLLIQRSLKSNRVSRYEPNLEWLRNRDGCHRIVHPSNGICVDWLVCHDLERVDQTNEE